MVQPAPVQLPSPIGMDLLVLLPAQANAPGMVALVSVLLAKPGMVLAVGLIAQRSQAKFAIVQVKVVFVHLVRVCSKPLV